jgi:arylsulfatase A
MNKKLGLLISFLSAILPGFANPTTVYGDTKPNIILVLVDDMGERDLGSYGNKLIETPNLDKLAAEGMKFTQSYSACTVCSPTRAALMAGKYPARLHLTDFIPQRGLDPKKKKTGPMALPDWKKFLPLDEEILAEKLGKVGYETIAIGKWHLGEEAYFPKKAGFNQEIGISHRGQPKSYFAPYQELQSMKEGPKGEYLTDRLTDETIATIEKNKSKPFFIYLSHYSPHKPLQAKAEMIEKYEKKDSQIKKQEAQYAAMVESIDQGIGRILAKLEKEGLAENTLFIFTSDNGGLLGPTSCKPYRAGKGSAYEGGVRIPLIIKWPATIKPGSECTVPVISQDIHHTIVEIAGAASSPENIQDGVSMLPLLKQSGEIQREALFWHYPHYHSGGATPYGAVRHGNFRLLEFYGPKKVELYDLSKDPGEKNDLADSNPSKRDELLAMLKKWREEVGAQMPTPK